MIYSVHAQHRLCITGVKSLQTPWIPSLDLTVYDKEAIECDTGLLCDKHMAAANKILARQFPNLQDLQSTLLAQTDGFLPISTGSNAGYIPEGKCWYLF